MTTIVRPYYAARVLGAPDVPVSVREDAGRIALDSSRGPHVDGSLLLAVPDAGMLDDLDPRDARRLVLDVYPESHLEPTYSAWVEQRRNRFKNTLTGANLSNVTAVRGNLTNGAGYTRLTITDAVAAAYAQRIQYAGLDRIPVTPGKPFAVDVDVRTSRAGLALVIAVGFYTAGNVLIGSVTPGMAVAATGAAWVPASFTAAEVPAGAATAMVYIGPAGSSARAIGDTIDARQITDAGFPKFDGSTPSTDPLTQYRWTGAANASESIMEARRLTGQQQIPDGAPRTFDLGIREATPSRADATVTVQLASDEALLDDYAQLVDDKSPRVHQASLRAVVNYVLGKIGAALQPGAADADVTAYWQVVNQITNPRLALDAVGWQTGSGASSGGRVVMSAPLPAVGNTAYRWTASAGESNVVPVTSRYRVTPGKWYVFFAYICSGTARQARAAIQWWSAGGSVASATSLGALVSSDVTQFRQVAVIAQCPPGAEEAVPYVSTLANAAGNLHYATMSMLYEGDELVPYFDGATADTAQYEYEFQAAAHNSTSTRTPTIERPPAALTWPAGVSGLQFLAPLVQASGFRLVCNERRQWSLRSSEYREPGAQTYREGVNITSADEQLSRSSDEWFDGVVFAYTWTDDDGIEQTRLDAYALPGATKVVRREISAPYPGPGRAQYAVTRAQGRGRTVTATKQAEWTEAADQEFSALLDSTPLQVGIANRVEFDIGANTVTATSRTTDTPAGAIVLLPGTIINLPGTINTL